MDLHLQRSSIRLTAYETKNLGAYVDVKTETAGYIIKTRNPAWTVVVIALEDKRDVTTYTFPTADWYDEWRENLTEDNIEILDVRYRGASYPKTQVPLLEESK